MNGLSEFFASILEQCLERGMQLPLVVCAVGQNHSVLVTRAHGGGVNPDVLAEHYEGGSFALPINVMVISQDSQAVRVVIDHEGGTIRTTYH